MSGYEAFYTIGKQSEVMTAQNTTTDECTKEQGDGPTTTLKRRPAVCSVQ